MIQECSVMHRFLRILKNLRNLKEVCLQSACSHYFDSYMRLLVYNDLLVFVFAIEFAD